MSDILTGSIIVGAKEYHAGDKVPESTDAHPVDLERLKRLGLLRGEARGEAPSRGGGRPKSVEHAHGDSKHKHPLTFGDLSTSSLANIAKSHNIEVDTSREDEAAVRADLLSALQAAHPAE